VKKVLIITYYWVPAGGVAVQRFLKFTKYLRQFGWEPVILTVENGSYPYTDESLAKQIPEGVKVYRTKTFEPFEIYNLFRGQKGKAVPLAVVSDSNKSTFQKISTFIRANFFLPDARKGWLPYAVKKANEIIPTEGIQAIITTGPPHSTHLIGQRLKALHNIPWVADFRDPWTEIFNNQYLPFTDWARAKDKHLEASVLRDCDVATMIGEGMRDVFPAEFSSKIRVVSNGYDEDDFDSTVKVDRDKFRMRYVGNLFSNEDVPALWQAIAELRQSDPNFKRDFELEIIGRADAQVNSSIEAEGIKDCVVYGSFIPHREAIRKMQSSSLLLSVIPNLANNKLIVTGKIFEYIGTGRPVFLVAPLDSDAAHIIAGSEAGYIHDYNDGNKMKLSLMQSYQAYTQGLESATHSNREQYNRRNLTGTLAGILDSLLAK
jgi:glycosyltransferase involved in cell wall biosynthesis